jgi:orotidine-5'-phosphate decarboxylase
MTDDRTAQPAPAARAADERLIVALDHGDLEDALDLVARLADRAMFYKVGLTLYTAAGPRAVAALRERGKRVFLDLKLHDIPVQVGGAAAAAARLGVDLLTVHAAGGEAMMRAAAGAVAGSGTRIIAVTLLTSLVAPDDSGAFVLRTAEQAVTAGVDGVVASAAEAAALRGALGVGPLIVTPGIRLVAAGADDQARVGRPDEALRAGASHLVVGRPITAAKDPVRAATELLRIMGSVPPPVTGSRQPAGRPVPGLQGRK